MAPPSQGPARRPPHGWPATSLTLMLLAVLLGACGGGASPRSTPPPPIAPVGLGTAPAATSASTALPTPPSRIGKPVRFKIPVLRVDAAVEAVGLTPDNAMDVPQDPDDVAWYALGPRPGGVGSAVIAGHVDWQTRKVVFWDRHRLKPGNAVLTVGDDGAEHRFVVTKVVSYPTADAPLEQIFNVRPAPGAHLNLVTCDQRSPFDKQRHEYARRLVVYTDAAP